MASGFLTMGAAARRGFGILAFAIFGALTLSFALADRAAAQESTLIYRAEPSSLVSVNAKGGLIVLPQTGDGLMTATIIGITGVMENGAFVPNVNYRPGTLFTTIRILRQCSITNGCAAFGLEDHNTAADRASAFAEMGLTTLSMFIASGANVNELVDGDYPLMAYLADAGASMNMSVLVSAGASINAAGDGGSALHYAVLQQNRAAITLLVNAGADGTITDENDRTPWHLAIFLSRASSGDGKSRLEEIRALINTGASGLNHAEQPYGTPLNYAGVGGIPVAPIIILLNANGGLPI